MTYEELVEKIRSIIADGCGCDRHCETRPDQHEACGCAEDAEAAVAAIHEALREPTNEMVKAGVAHRMKTTIGSWPADTAKLFGVILAASPLVKKDGDNG